MINNDLLFKRPPASDMLQNIADSFIWQRQELEKFQNYYPEIYNIILSNYNLSGVLSNIYNFSGQYGWQFAQVVNDLKKKGV